MKPDLTSRIVESLAEEGRVPAGEREAIAGAIESELARLLPSPPAWLPEQVARAVQVALRLAGKLMESPEHRDG